MIKLDPVQLHIIGVMRRSLLVHEMKRNTANELAK